jgi:hypothetical protein
MRLLAADLMAQANQGARAPSTTKRYWESWAEWVGWPTGAIPTKIDRFSAENNAGSFAS